MFNVLACKALNRNWNESFDIYYSVVSELLINHAGNPIGIGYHEHQHDNPAARGHCALINTCLCSEVTETHISQF
jgi:hypothetical protein